MAQPSAEVLEHTGLAEYERVASVPQREQLASTPEPPLPKAKRNRAVSPEHQIVRGRKSRWARAAPWRERRGIRAEAWSGKGGLHSEKSRFQGEKGGQARRASLGEVEGRMNG